MPLNMNLSGLISITISICFLNCKTQGNRVNKLGKVYASPDHYIHKLHNLHQEIILMQPKPKLLKQINDIDQLFKTSSESDSNDLSQEALRKRGPQSSDSEQYNSTEIEKVIFLPNNTHKYIKTAEVVDSTNEDIDKGGKTGQSLREIEELKCMEACEEVLGNVCDVHKCGNKERHIFEKECFDACVKRFRK